MEKYTIPNAIPSKGVGIAYYKALLDEVPHNYSSIPIIVHCIVAQVSVYDCFSEDLEALEIAKLNKQMVGKLENTFQKLGHCAQSMPKPCNAGSGSKCKCNLQTKKEANETNHLVMEELPNNTPPDADLTSRLIGRQMLEFKECFMKNQDNDNFLCIVHEFDKFGRLEAMVKNQLLMFWDSVDVIKVEKHMLSLLNYPGKNRASMPHSPLLSEEKQYECLKALQMFANGGPETYEKDDCLLYKELDDIYGPPVIQEIPQNPLFQLKPVNFAIVQRFKKLKMFLETLLRKPNSLYYMPPILEEQVLPKYTCKKMDSISNDSTKTLFQEEKHLEKSDCTIVENNELSTSQLDFNISSFSTISPSSKPIDMALIYQKILERNMFESYPNDLLGEIYCKAKIRLPYRLLRYDDEDDCLLEVLYADERDHIWKGTMASEIGLDGIVANKNHTSYDIEPQDATIFEQFKCHLTENEGFVWTGLPSKTATQMEPQTTVIKDSNMILLRSYGENDNSQCAMDKNVIAILRDGIVVCFFIAKDGTMTMQITNPASETIEINSTGVVLMYSSKLHSQVEPKEAQVDVNQSTPQKLAQEVSTSDEKCDKSFAYQSYVETIKDVLLLEKGDVEDWRCVLPLGTVVCYKNNKNIQIMCQNGNVSDWRADLEEPCWITTNNEGCRVIQQDPPIEGESNMLRKPEIFSGTKFKYIHQEKNIYTDIYIYIYI
nr:uncharacterized protein LOC112288459 isoform X1 [Physcomitrium patens]|eukprot:XP_024388406.1 uncharacterized protein LOC112288459 isoform X1 [Physcomitrella patens]